MSAHLSTSRSFRRASHRGIWLSLLEGLSLLQVMAKFLNSRPLSTKLVIARFGGCSLISTSSSASHGSHLRFFHHFLSPIPCLARHGPENHSEHSEPEGPENVGDRHQTRQKQERVKAQSGASPWQSSSFLSCFSQKCACALCGRSSSLEDQNKQDWTCYNKMELPCFITCCMTKYLHMSLS